MFKYNPFTGEQDMNSPNNNFGIISEEQVVQNANLTPMGGGGYVYDTNSRFQQLYQQQQAQGTYQTMSGFGQYMSTSPGYNENPAYAFLAQNPNIGGAMNPPQQPQERVIRVPGLNYGGEMIPPADIRAKIDQLQLEMEIELDEVYQQKLEQQRKFFGQATSNGMNYYNMPCWNINYNDPTVIAKYRKKIEQLRDEAIQRRYDLNRRFSKMCHNYMGEEINEEELDKIYNDQYITIPVEQQQEDQLYDYLETFKEYDPSIPYKKHFMEVTEAHNKYFEGGKADLSTYLNNVGQMRIDEALEAERNKQKDATGYYKQDGSYRRLLRRKLYERKMGESLPEGQEPPATVHGQNMLTASGMFPTLANSATLLEDGSLQINVPDWQGTGQAPILIRNEMEQTYEQNRSAFIQSIYQDDPRPGGGV